MIAFLNFYTNKIIAAFCCLKLFTVLTFILIFIVSVGGGRGGVFFSNRYAIDSGLNSRNLDFLPIPNIEEGEMDVVAGGVVGAVPIGKFIPSGSILCHMLDIFKCPMHDPKATYMILFRHFVLFDRGSQ